MSIGEQTDEETVTLEEIVDMVQQHQQVVVSDNRIEVSIGSEGVAVSMHTNELTFEELKKEVHGMLKSLSQNKPQPHDNHDVNIT